MTNDVMARCRVLAQCSEEPGFITAELDLTRITEMRTNIPAWRDNQAFSINKL